MKRIDIPRSNRNDQSSGCWWDTGARIVVKCPECDQIAGLDHDIKRNGDVEPSLDCPNPECGFHNHVRLLDWN